jgi:hypothetical protein
MGVKGRTHARDHYFKDGGQWYAVIGGEKATLSEWSKRYGVTPHLVRNRVLRNVGIGDIFVETLYEARHMIEIEFAGDVWCVNTRILAEAVGVSLEVLRRRLNDGWPIEDALDPGAGVRRRSRVQRLITFRGKTQGLSQWAREIGLERVTLRERLKYMSVERALTQPLKKRGKK